MSNKPDDAFFGFMRAALAGEELACDSDGQPAVSVTSLPAWQDSITPARMERLAQATMRLAPGKKVESEP